MTAPPASADLPRETVGAWDGEEALTAAERVALADLDAWRRARPFARWPAPTMRRLIRPTAPWHDALARLGALRSRRSAHVGVVLRATHEAQTAFWTWDDARWQRLFRRDDASFCEAHGAQATRRTLRAAAYLVGVVPDPERFCPLQVLAFATRVLGAETVDASLGRVDAEMDRLGYSRAASTRVPTRTAVAGLLLLAHSPRLEDLTTTHLGQAFEQRTGERRYALLRAAGILRRLGVDVGDVPVADGRAREAAVRGAALLDGVHPVWASWCERWLRTTTFTPGTARSTDGLLLQAGRWLARTHPDDVSPEQWTRQTAAEFIAAAADLRTLRWTARRGQDGAPGKPATARTIVRLLGAVRALVRDAQEWEWMPRRFDPNRAFRPPRAVQVHAAPRPRTLEDDVWAKLLWAGLNLTAGDLTGAVYPLETVRAVAAVWLLTGLRSDEIRRLRVGCARTDHLGQPAGTRPVYLLDVPKNKTAGAFTKPVDRAVADAIAAWEAVRPPHPPLVDAKTGEVVDFLFARRGHALGQDYLNEHLIPLLCRTSGVPEADARGSITSHRARSTIASQLANAAEPMTLLELQQWLGHRLPSSTLHYVRASDRRVATSFAAARHFERNMRLVEVLVDREAVTSGAAAAGEPWRFYDLGHGYCTYDFFAQCPHRMACARCSFYRPKGSTQAQLLEGKANLLRMKQDVLLTDDERAAVDDGVSAPETLCARLADVPTPAGPTPRNMAQQADP